MIMSFYLLEVGTEEIPSSFIKPAVSFLNNQMQLLLKSNNIAFDNIISNATPRRLYLYIKGIAPKQKEETKEIIGPPASKSLDKEEIIQRQLWALQNLKVLVLIC